MSTHRLLLGAVEEREMAAMNGMLGDLSEKAFVLDPKLMGGLDGHTLVTGNRTFSVYHLAGRWPDRVAAIALLGAFQLAIRWDSWRWRILDRGAAAIADKQGGLLPGDRWRIGTWRDGRVLGMHGVWANQDFQVLAGPPAKVPTFPALACGEGMLIERAQWDASGDLIARAWDRCGVDPGESGKPLIARWSPKTGAKVEAVSLETFNDDVPEPESFVFDAGGGRRYASRPNRLWESRDGAPYVEIPLPEIPAAKIPKDRVLRIDTGRVVGDEIWLGGSFVHEDTFWEMDFQASGYDRYVVLHTTPDPALPTSEEIHKAHHALTLKRCPGGRTLLADEFTCARDRVARFVQCMVKRAEGDDDLANLRSTLSYGVTEDHTKKTLAQKLRKPGDLNDEELAVIEACDKATR